MILKIIRLNVLELLLRTIMVRMSSFKKSCPFYMTTLLNLNGTSSHESKFRSAHKISQAKSFKVVGLHLSSLIGSYILDVQEMEVLKIIYL